MTENDKLEELSELTDSSSDIVNTEKMYKEKGVFTMTKHKGISVDGVILAIIAGLLLQAIIFNLSGINATEVPVKVILISWIVLASGFGILAELTDF